MNTDIKSYIDESKEWYAKKYLQQKVEVFKGLISLVLISVSLYIVKQGSNSTTNIVSMNFPIYIDENVDELHDIKSLFDKKESISQMIAKYMVKRYILLRETYSPVMLEEQKWNNLLINIYGLSTYKSFDEYLLDIIPSKNPKSPILKYRFNSTISVDITQIKVITLSNNKPVSAVVDFSTTTCNLDHMKCFDDDWTAEVKFEMSDITKSLVEEEDPNFFFKISDYKKTKKIT